MAVLHRDEQQLAALQVVNDSAGYRDLLRLARRWPQRTWAVEGAGGVGVQLAQRLVVDGETVDVPPKLNIQARMFDIGHGAKNDPVDARTVAVVALRTRRLRTVVLEGNPATQPAPPYIRRMHMSAALTSFFRTDLGPVRTYGHYR